jgi:hypothetical protein
MNYPFRTLFQLLMLLSFNRYIQIGGFDLTPQILSTMTDLRSNNSSLGRIALLISMYFPPEPGGGSTTAWNRVLILSKIGHSVYVLYGFPSYPTGRVNEDAYKLDNVLKKEVKRKKDVKLKN